MANRPAKRITTKLDGSNKKETFDIYDEAAHEHLDELDESVTNLQTSLTTQVNNLQATMQSKVDNMQINLQGQIDDIGSQVDQTVDELNMTLNTRLDAKIDSAYVEDGYLYLTSNNEIVAGPLGPFSGSGGGGGGESNNAVLTLTNTSGWLSKTISENSECIVSLNWSSIENEIATGNGVLKITVNGATRATLDVAQGPVLVNVANYLSTGTNVVKMAISDVYGNRRSINYTISVVAMSLTSSFDSKSPKAGEFMFPYTPTGKVEKTVHFVVDGTDIGTQVTSVSGRQQSYTIPAQTHGHHTLLSYFEAEVNGETVKSNELYYDVICVADGNTEPIIVSSFRTEEVEQFTTLAIPYIVYDPANLTSTVQFYANNVLVSEQTVDRTEQIWSYRTDTIGTFALKIKVGSTERVFNVQVNESVVTAKLTTDDLVLSLSADGRSNNEANPDTWTYKDIACTFSGFNHTSDGWQMDETDSTVLRVAGDARLVIPYKPFAKDFRGTGKTIEIDFATRDVLNYDSPILTCMDSERGLYITANEAILSSEQSKINAQYKENEHVRLSFVAEKRSENRLLYVYINGVMSGVIQYPDDDDFSQQVPKEIAIGSNFCTMDIYAIRIYDNDLTRYQVLDNWIADTQDVSVMLDRYRHNNITDEYGNVVIARLPNDLPYMIISCDELPQYKGDKKTVSVSYVDPQIAANSFTATGVQANVQGTSSAPYARKNYDLQFKSGFEINGEHADNYALKPTVVPFNRFVLKADVASSEGANNVELVRLYCDTSPFKTREMDENPKVRQGIDGFPIVLFWNDTANSNTQFMGKYNFNLPKRAPGPYGYSGDMESWEFENNTSDLLLFKSDYFNETLYTNEEGDQLPEWRKDFEARFPSDAWLNHDKIGELVSFVVSTDRTKATNAALKSPVKYGDITYTTDSADYRLAKFKAEFPTYAELNSFLFYYIFTELFLMVDSRAKNLFIGFSGSDVTASGRIATRKAVAEPYDMDTAIGTNNEGALVFGYSLEDTDHLSGGADIFNGQDSVLWCNVRDAYSAEIAVMYQNLRSAGKLSFANVEKRFEDHQNKWNEAIFNEDSYFKYLAPLIAPDPGKEPTATYLHMLQGSKKEQRVWWLYNRFRYMDSKFNAGDALSDVIQLRGYAKDNITVTPYADVYASVKYGSYLVQQRAQRNNPVTLVCPLDNVNDTEIYIYSASQLAEIGDLSGLKVGFADFSHGTKLSSLKVGDASSIYNNPNLKTLYVGTNGLLQTVDARNCSALGTDEQTTVDLSGATNIENVYFDGTAVKGVSLPNGGILKVLHLPSTITNLTILNQQAITDFTVPSLANITTLRIENSSVDSKSILNSIAANSRVRLIGFTWECTDAAEIESLLDKFDTMRGLDEQGNNMDKAQVSGTLHTASLTGAQVASYNERYPYINVTADNVTSVLTFKSYDGETTIKTVTCVNGVMQEGAPAVPARAQTAQYTYTANGWALSANSVSDPNATTNVIADRTVYAAYIATVRTYTVIWKNADGTVLETDNNVPYGATPTYNSTTPTYNGETSRGWLPTISSVTGDITYTAAYKPVYQVTFKSQDGSSTLQTVDVMEGETAKYTGSTPTNTEGTTFLGWSNSTGSSTVDAVLTNITASKTVYAAHESAVEVAEITDTWDQIISEIDAGTYKTKYKLGNYKPLDLGTEGTINMQIIGKDVDELANGSGTAPLTFLGMEHLNSSKKMNATKKTAGSYTDYAVGGWEMSDMRSYLKNTIKPLIPEIVRNRIVNVTKIQGAYLADGFTAGNQTTVDDVWIPGDKEIFNSVSCDGANGHAYNAVFKDATSRKKHKNGGSDTSWWLRSCRSSTSNFCRVTASGYDGDDLGSYSYGVALGFCLGFCTD